MLPIMWLMLVKQRICWLGDTRRLLMQFLPGDNKTKGFDFQSMLPVDSKLAWLKNRRCRCRQLVLWVGLVLRIDGNLRGFRCWGIAIGVAWLTNQIETLVSCTRFQPRNQLWHTTSWSVASPLHKANDVSVEGEQVTVTRSSETTKSQRGPSVQFGWKGIMQDLPMHGANQRTGISDAYSLVTVGPPVASDPVRKSEWTRLSSGYSSSLQQYVS